MLSFNVSDCDDSSHMFDAFGDVFRCVYLQHLDCQCGCPLQVWNANVVVVWANVCCGKETTNDDTDNIKLNRTEKSLMTSSTIFFPRLMWSFLLLGCISPRARSCTSERLGQEDNVTRATVLWRCGFKTRMRFRTPTQHCIEASVCVMSLFKSSF